MPVQAVVAKVVEVKSTTAPAVPGCALQMLTVMGPTMLFALYPNVALLAATAEVFAPLKPLPTPVVTLLLS